MPKTLAPFLLREMKQICGENSFIVLGLGAFHRKCSGRVGRTGQGCFRGIRFREVREPSAPSSEARVGREAVSGLGNVARGASALQGISAA